MSPTMEKRGSEKVVFLQGLQHEDLSRIPSTCEESRVWWCIRVTPVLGGTEWRLPGTSQCRLIREPRFQVDGSEGNAHRADHWSPHSIHTHTHKFTHLHILHTEGG